MLKKHQPKRNGLVAQAENIEHKIIGSAKTEVRLTFLLVVVVTVILILMPCTSQCSASCWSHVRGPSHSCRPNIYKLWTNIKKSLRQKQSTRIQTKEISKSKLKSFCNITTPINTAGSRAGKKTLMNWFAQTHATAHACLSKYFRSVLVGALLRGLRMQSIVFVFFHFLWTMLRSANPPTETADAVCEGRRACIQILRTDA